VVHAHGSGGPLVVQDLESLLRAHVESLEMLPAQLEQWLAPRLQRARPAYPVALTRSEARVARLAADGLTNKRIGLVLGVRLRTVESHLTSAYRKLGVQSRYELERLL
jgi:DNA-binding CsgD family transcriptional regulator